MLLESGEGPADRVENGVGVEKLPGMAQEVGDTPTGCAGAVGLADPAQLLLDPPSNGDEPRRKLLFQVSLKSIPITQSFSTPLSL